MRPKVIYFFRKRRSGAYSIENLFCTIQAQLQEKIDAESYTMSFQSNGLINRLKIILEAARNRGDINHITGDINFIAFGLPKAKTVLTIHDIESLERNTGFSDFLLNLFWLKLPVKAVSKITVISEHTKAKLLQKIKVTYDKIVVIPNPVSRIYKYTPKIFSKNKPNLLQVGTKSNKNLESLIPAIEGIACTLTIVGKISENQLLLLQKHNIEYVVKTGISNEELVQEYSKADIITFVSLFEGFGLPIIEANAVGRPVITSNRGAMAEVAADAALLVDPLSVKAIREGILEIINNEVLRDKLVKKGLENVKRYQPDVVAAQYLALYEQMTL